MSENNRKELKSIKKKEKKLNAKALVPERKKFKLKKPLKLIARKIAQGDIKDEFVRIVKKLLSDNFFVMIILFISIVYISHHTSITKGFIHPILSPYNSTSKIVQWIYANEVKSLAFSFTVPLVYRLPKNVRLYVSIFVCLLIYLFKPLPLHEYVIILTSVLFYFMSFHMSFKYSVLFVNFIFYMFGYLTLAKNLL